MEKEQTLTLLYTCSFCAKHRNEVEHLIVGPNQIYICNECVQECNQILAHNNPHSENSQHIQTIPIPQTPSPNANVDTAVQSLQETILNVLAYVGPSDPRYQQFAQAFDDSLKRLQEMKRPLLSGKETLTTTQFAASYAEVLRLANIEKRRLTDSALDTTHFLLALLLLPSGNVAYIFDMLKSNRNRLRQNIEAVHRTKIVHQDKQTQDPFARLSGLTPAADQAIKFAYEESHNLLSASIASEHLLLGLLRIEHDAEIDVFKLAGLRLAVVRHIVSEIASKNQ